MTFYFPLFLKLGLIIWTILIAIFIGFTLFIRNQPDEHIHKVKAQAIENKKRLGIKIYRMH